MSEESALEKVCLNCQYSFYGYGESSINYGLRCSLSDNATGDRDTCNGYEIHSFYRARQLEQQLSKAQADLELACEALGFYKDSRNLGRFETDEFGKRDYYLNDNVTSKATETLKQIKEKKG